ncbi:FAD-dependent oxidoreductase, partial [bacterium]|nr:FAD-dependent oxidoreductase [bacterium]
VTLLGKNQVTLESGEIIEASRVIVATESAVTTELVGGFAEKAPEWRAVTNLYFDANESPLSEAIIALNGSLEGLVNNVAVMSDVSVSYAPAGRSLVSVSVLGENDGEDLPERVKAELSGWFGDEVKEWRHLRSDLIRHALPEQRKTEPVGVHKIDGFLICGDHAVSASIEGAMSSGVAAAKACLAKYEDR